MRVTAKTRIWRATGALAMGLAASSAAAASKPPTECDAIVRAARSQPIRPAKTNRATDLERLLPAALGTPSPLSRDPTLLAKAKQLFDANQIDGIEMQPVAHGVWRAQVTQGTLHCTDDRFFRLAADGKLSLVATPPSYDELCNTSWRQMRSGANGPALVEIDTRGHPDVGLDIEVTPWDDGWGAACRASLRFTDSFQATERFCGDMSICAAGAKASPGLARLIARSGGRTPPGMTEVRTSYPDVRGALATFGAAAKTEFTDYSDTQGSFAVAIGGRSVLAHVGIGGVGWRAIGDYLVTLYPPGDIQHPLAGYVVERRVAGLKSATTSIPKPWVNPH